MADRRVTVITQESLYQDADSGTFAARFPAMGLTVYGNTEAEAVNALQQLFDYDINYYRSKGLLEEHLNRLDVRWCWADDDTELNGYNVAHTRSRSLVA